MESQKKSERIVKNNGKNWQMWNISIFGGNQSQVLNKISSWLAVGNGPKWLATVNPEFVMAAEKDPNFRKILNTTSLNVADGIGLIWAREVMSGKSPAKVGIEILRGEHRENLITGTDLMDKMCGLAEKEGKTVYFFGGWGNRSERTAKYFLKKYPNLKVTGFGEENFDFNIMTDILFVARGMKKQEEWIANHFDKLKVKIVMGVGRCFDYYSGDLKRAPKQWRKMGLEWLYSLYQEPKRWKRQIVLPKFIWKVLFS